MELAFIVHVAEPDAFEHLRQADEYTVAKAFVDGKIRIEGDLLAAVRWWRRQVRGETRWCRARATLNVAFGGISRWWQTRGAARRAIGFHYDVGNEFYRQFLDSRLVYSCAYFRRADETLEQRS